MTGSEKYTWGLVLSIGGSFVLFGGIALTATLFGACIGLPMALAGLPLMIWGMVWAYQGHFQKQQEVITAGIRDGIAYMHGVNTSPSPPAPVAASMQALPAPAAAAPMAPLLTETIEHQAVAGDPDEVPQLPTSLTEESQVDLEGHADKGDARTDGSALPS